MIETRGLTKRFGQKLAVDSIDLEIGKGVVFGFLGPNGAGKTTTVRMLSCLVAPSAGEARVGDFLVGRDDHQIRRMVGMLTESPGLYDRLSAYYNLEFYARLQDIPKEQRSIQIEKQLRLLDLWEHRNEPVGIFSKGMKQKIALARSLIHEPQVLFLDEPTAGLDPESAKIVRDAIAEMRSEGRTIFLCTHNLDEADRLCDRIAILNQRIVALGTPADLRRSGGQRHRTRLQLRVVTDAVLSAVKRLAFVEHVDQRERELVVSMGDPEVQNPLLVRAVVEAGGEVQYVNEAGLGLEEVYLNLIHQAESKQE